ncbi:MAG: hypothetical protein R3D98_00655 [Candidatus Krumholzibacteriia bacterium]
MIHDRRRHVLHDAESGGLLRTDPGVRQQWGAVSGAGLALEFDDRDRVFAPSRGVYGSASAIGYPELLGSAFQFEAYEVDLRLFLPAATRHTLAAQAYLQLDRGSVPFWHLPTLGDLPHSRAYEAHRLRDRTLAAAQLEWRWTWTDRLGCEVFAGGAWLDRTLPDLRVDAVQPSLGASLRFTRRMGDDLVPFRIGAAWGNDGWRAVVGAGDAF